jgi:hypothetical protein
MVRVAGTASAHGTIDVVSVARRRISPVSLRDAARQAVIVLGWLVGSGRGR